MPLIVSDEIVSDAVWHPEEVWRGGNANLTYVFPFSLLLCVYLCPKVHSL